MREILASVGAGAVVGVATGLLNLLKKEKKASEEELGEILIAQRVVKRPGDPMTVRITYRNEGAEFRGGMGFSMRDIGGGIWNCWTGGCVRDPGGRTDEVYFRRGEHIHTMTFTIPTDFPVGDVDIRASIWERVGPDGRPGGARLADTGWIDDIFDVAPPYRISIVWIDIS